MKLPNIPDPKCIAPTVETTKKAIRVMPEDVDQTEYYRELDLISGKACFDQLKRKYKDDNAQLIISLLERLTYVIRRLALTEIAIEDMIEEKEQLVKEE